MIIKRYLVREILKVMTPSLLILVTLFTSSALVKYLSYATRGDISVRYLPKLLLIELPGLLGILIPVALFFSILLAVARGYAQNEMVVLGSSGMGNFRIARMLSGLILVMAVAVGSFVFWLRPQLLQVKADLIAYAKANALVDMFKPGQFQTIGKDKKRTLYIGAQSPHKKSVTGVFTSFENDKGGFDITMAKNGYLEKYHGGRYFVLKDGAKYRGEPGETQYHVTNFGAYKSLIRQSSIESSSKKVESLSTKELVQSAMGDPEMMAELEWRISIPLMLVILALLAIPLGYVPPRSNQYASVVPALLILVLYINGILVMRDAVEDARINPWLGVWWLHALFILLTVYLFKRRMR